MSFVDVWMICVTGHECTIPFLYMSTDGALNLLTNADLGEKRET